LLCYKNKIAIKTLIQISSQTLKLLKLPPFLIFVYEEGNFNLGSNWAALNLREGRGQKFLNSYTNCKTLFILRSDCQNGFTKHSDQAFWLLPLHLDFDLGAQKYTEVLWKKMKWKSGCNPSKLRKLRKSLVFGFKLAATIKWE